MMTAWLTAETPLRASRETKSTSRPADKKQRGKKENIMDNKTINFTIRKISNKKLFGVLHELVLLTMLRGYLKDTKSLLKLLVQVISLILRVLQNLSFLLVFHTRLMLMLLLELQLKQIRMIRIRFMYYLMINNLLDILLHIFALLRSLNHIKERVFAMQVNMYVARQVRPLENNLFLILFSLSPVCWKNSLKEIVVQFVFVHASKVQLQSLASVYFVLIFI